MAQSAIEQAGNISSQIESRRATDFRIEQDSQRFKSQSTDIKKHQLDEANKNEQCYQINTIEYFGNQVLSNKTIDKIVQPYRRCLTAIDINNLQKDVINLYIDHGYTTTWVYLEPTNIARNKKISLEIVEGKVSDINLKQHESFKKLSIGTAFGHDKKGEVFKRL